jgi:hypothetical protein
MQHVPIWILTAVIEFSLLSIGALAGVLCVVWRSKRRLGRRVRELEQTFGAQPLGLPTLPELETPGTAAREEPDGEPEEVAAQAVSEALLSPDEALAALAAVGLDTQATVESPASVEPLTEPAIPFEQGEVPEPLAETSTEIFDFMAPEDVPADTAHADASTEEPEEDSLSGLLSQDALDALFASSSSAESPAADTGDTDAAQHIATMLSESAAMEKQLEELQEKSAALRQAVENLQANQALPLEEQQDVPVPEKMMQDIENGLAALEQSRERLQEALQQHAHLLGGDGDEANKISAQVQDEETVKEITQLKTELEMRTADFARVQAEYNALLGEYQRIFEGSQEPLQH